MPAPLPSGRSEPLLLLGALLDLDAEEIADDLLLDRRGQLLEHRVALRAVLGERVLLGHGTEVDAVAEVLHRLEVLAPAHVHDLEDEVTLDVAQELGAVLLDLGRVGVLSVLLELLDQLLAGQRRPGELLLATSVS